MRDPGSGARATPHPTPTAPKPFSWWSHSPAHPRGEQAETVLRAQHPKNNPERGHSEEGATTEVQALVWCWVCVPPPRSHGCSRPARADGKINELITSALHSPKSNPKSQIQPQSQPQSQTCTPGAWQRRQCPPPAPQGWFGEGAAPQFVPSQPQPPPHAPIPSGSACGEASGALSSPQIEGLLIKVIRAAAWPLPCQRVRGRCRRLGASGEGRGANKSLPRGGTSPGCTDAPSQPSCPLCPTPQDFAPSPGCSHPVLWPRGLI